MGEFKIRIDAGVKTHNGQVILRDFCFLLLPNTINWIYASNLAEMDAVIETLSGQESFDSAKVSTMSKVFSEEEARVWFHRNIYTLCNEDFLIEGLSIADNFIICSGTKQPFWVRDKKNRAITGAILKKYHVDIGLDQRLSSLDALKRYQLQLLKCFFQERYLVLVDMRKLQLSGAELNGFMDTMQLLAKGGMSFIVVGLMGSEFRCGVDQIIVINKGITTLQEDMHGVGAHKRWIDHNNKAVANTQVNEGNPKAAYIDQKSALCIESIYTEKLRNLSLEIYHGEIVIIYVDAYDMGEELFNLLKGTVTAKRGTISVDNRRLNTGCPDADKAVSARVKEGIRCISSPNKQDFYFDNFEAWENYVFQKGMLTPEIWKRERLRSNLKKRLENETGKRLANKRSFELSQEEKMQIRFLSQTLIGAAVLVSEDPFSYVNPDKWRQMETIFEKITKRNVAILIISRFKDRYNMLQATHYRLKSTGEIVKVN